MDEFSILRRITPVVINSFNQPTYLKNIIRKFLDNGFVNIFILDNNSKYKPLIDLYQNLSKNGVNVLFYNENRGPRYFHLSGMYQSYFNNIPHIYTDPDLDFDMLAPDFLSTLISISNKYSVAKVGCALKIPEDEEIVDEYIYIKELKSSYKIKEWESQFWINKLEESIFKANIDTTLHYFNPTHYSGNFFDGIRVDGQGFTVKHLPWYKKNLIPKEESEFYSNHQNWSNYSTKS